MEIELSTKYSGYESLDTERYADNACPNCTEILYIDRDQKEKITEDLFLSCAEHEEYPCTCPRCGAEITLSVCKETLITFDIEE